MVRAFFHIVHKILTIGDNAGFKHFTQQVISFTCTFTNTRKYRVS